VTLRQALILASQKLSVLPDIDNPALESEILLRHALQISRAQLYLDLDRNLSADQQKTFRQWIDRRLQGEPAAYIFGSREFFGLDFYVDRRVLIPRPETELLVEEAIKIVNHSSPSSDSSPLEKGRLRGIFPYFIADIGTGSGAIAVSLAVNLPQVKVLAVDISATALEVAAINCRSHGVQDRVTLFQGDLLEPLKGEVNVLIANLPYVTTADVAKMPSAKFEPLIALDGGGKGLDLIWRLIPKFKDKIKSSGSALIEIGQGQSEAVTEYVRKLYPSAQIKVIQDLANIDRVVKIRF
jgi:release factor glutamine methyltransferase